MHTKPPERLTDEQINEGLKRRPYDRVAREAARVRSFAFRA